MAIASYGTMIVLLLVTDISLGWLIAVPNTVRAAINLLALRMVLRQIPKDAEPEAGGLSYGLETSLYNVANSVGNYIDKFLLFYLLSPEALAVFVVSERIPEISKKYFQQMRNVLVPSFSKKAKYTPELNRKINIASAVVTVAILFVIFAVIPWFMPLMFTDAYGESVLYCQLLMGTLIIGQVAQARNVFIVSRLDAKAMRNVTLGSNAIRILASAALVPFFGIYGAIASTAIYRVSTAVIVSLLMRRYK
ncbi:MAG: hypothetical protein CML50_13570 [Rhodobacteraceae bacterium]|uniref:Polysaccharide biosynthesis protein n=1 Tax=Salipiger profundus TaxID=1229727 RepID=A0A1U7D6T7_9RHOB|nr:MULTISPECIES: oligosaccharide flippase family protein [Salipiger]APX23822.1 hypothetical protein Ga0080559_TMP3026 [Salipiger profundus]MAB07023.1 hypothetical protein [Paracoccaceae bacterium]GGA18228.1 hypothetical protein GCM10011326_33530 [Salipiger profundus]